MTCLTKILFCDRIGVKLELNKMSFTRGYSKTMGNHFFCGGLWPCAFSIVHVHRPWCSPRKGSGFFFKEV